jgi:hypothetical protein
VALTVYDESVKPAAEGLHSLVISTLAGHNGHEFVFKAESTNSFVQAHICSFKRVWQVIQESVCVSVAVVQPDAQDLT